MTVALHPTRESLQAYTRGELPPAERSAVSEHVSKCAACRQSLGLGDVPADSVKKPKTIPAGLAEHPRYRILGELGAGGMGVVYKAEDQLMERVVALKVVAPHLTAKRSAVDRFLKEYRVAAKLLHQNIVTAFDAGEAGGYHFLVMEYVEGVSLDRYVSRKGPLPVTLAAQCARQAALGLQHAHERGMVHRDIKPQNLMITRKGQVKIMDFGLARIAHAEADETPAERGPFGSGKLTVPDALTNPNTVMGTPDYLSPEQARNSHEVDTRSDIYSLGCTLYYLLTGNPPFAHAQTLIDKLLAHTEEQPKPIRELRQDVPEGLAAVLMKMMAKDPAERYASPAEVAAALLPFTRPNDPGQDAKAGFEVMDPAVLTPSANGSGSDTPSIVRGPTESEFNRTRRSKKRKRRRVWWKQKWVVIAGAAVFGLLFAAIIASASKKKPQTPPAEDAQNPAERSAAVTPIPPPPRPNPWQVGDTKPAKGLKVLFVLPSNGVWLADFVPVRDRLTQAGVEVVTASTDGGESAPLPHPDNRGSPVKIDRRLTASFDTTPFAAVVFVGASAEEYGAFGRGAVAARSVIKQMLDARKPLAAISMGQIALVGNDMLRRRRAASCELLFQKLPFLARGPKSGIIWEDKPVVVDDLFITAGHTKDAVPFADAILKAITP